MLIFEQMKERDENLGTAGKHGKVGANLAMLLASQDLKPTAGSKAEGRCDCDKAVQPKVVSVDV